MEYLEQLDWDIIYLLRKNSRIPHSEIASKLDIDEDEVVNRVQRMEENNIIQGYTIVPNFAKLGYSLISYILVEIDEDQFNEKFPYSNAANIFSNLTNVSEVHRIVGEWDFLIKARFKELEDMGNFVSNQIMNLDGVMRSQFIVVFDSEIEELSNSSLKFFDILKK